VTTDQQEANALGFHRDAVAVYNNSWGPVDDGLHTEAPGPLTLAVLRGIVPDVVVATGTVTDEAARHSPGQDAIHYAPRARLVLAARADALAMRDASVILRGHGDPALPDAIVLPDDAAAYGAALYATLHALDDAGAPVIAVESPPDDEAWLAVADRLRRAAAK
jgi:L-threonylcarbamoyladenylate synthase